MDKREKQIAKKMRAAGKSASDEEREKRDRRAKHERQLERSKYKKYARERWTSTSCIHVYRSNLVSHSVTHLRVYQR